MTTMMNNKRLERYFISNQITKGEKMKEKYNDEQRVKGKNKVGGSHRLDGVMEDVSVHFSTQISLDEGI